LQVEQQAQVAHELGAGCFKGAQRSDVSTQMQWWKVGFAVHAAGQVIERR